MIFSVYSITLKTGKLRFDCTAPIRAGLKKGSDRPLKHCLLIVKATRNKTKKF